MLLSTLGLMKCCFLKNAAAASELCQLTCLQMLRACSAEIENTAKTKLAGKDQL